MESKQIHRPWERKSKGHGTRYNPDPFYQSTTWKQTKAAFKRGYTLTPDGRQAPNRLCYDCFVEGKITLGHTIDHHVRIKDGGSKTDHNNLRNLCSHHHAVKSANEGNQSRKKK